MTDPTLRPTVPTVPVPVSTAPAVPETVEAPEALPAPEPPEPINWRDEFADLDKNKDKKLATSELKLAGARGTDLNKDGRVDLREFRSAKLRDNSFEGLDRNGDNRLDAEELARMQRFDDRQYGDGQSVTKAEFLATRAAEMADNREARLTEKFEAGLDADEKKRMQRFAGEDGKLSAEEYVEGKKQLHEERHAERRDQLFKAAGGKNGTLDVTTEAGARYRSYDADGDGRVSKQEFKQGYQQDLQAAREARLESGELKDKGVRDRLAFGRDGFAEAIEAPAPTRDLHGTRAAWFISQYGTKFNPNEDVPGWDNANCGPTSLTMVAKAFGKINPGPGEADAAIERSRKLMGDSQDERSGTSGEGVARGAEAYGLDAEIVNDITLSGIEQELAKGRLAVVNGNVIRPDGSYGGGHFYVVTKIEDGKAYLNDPYSKTGPTVVSTDRLMHSINSHWSHRIISIGEK